MLLVASDASDSLGAWLAGYQMHLTHRRIVERGAKNMATYEYAAGDWTKRYNARWQAERLRNEIEPKFRAMERRAKVAIKGMFEPYAWPGGYQMVYIDQEEGLLCPDCAKAEYIEQGTKFTGDIYYEGPTMYCENCNRALPSAYGDPDATEE
jgi:hypothetical protein